MLWCEEENFRLKFKKEGKKSCRNLASIKRKPREALDKQREVQNTRYCTQANGHASAERQDRIINRGEIDEEGMCVKNRNGHNAIPTAWIDGRYNGLVPFAAVNMGAQNCTWRKMKMR